jgi:hypothetical protein
MTVASYLSHGGKERTKRARIVISFPATLAIVTGTYLLNNFSFLEIILNPKNLKPFFFFIGPYEEGFDFSWFHPYPCL